jgi:hypothetical protein
MTESPQGEGLKMPDPAWARKRLSEHHKAVMAKERERIERGRRLQGHVHVANVDSATWTQIVDVTGAGWLTSLAVSGGPRYHDFQIEIDGEEVVADCLAGTNLSEHVNNSVALELPFYERMIVRVRDRPQRSVLPRYWVAWVTEPVQFASRERAIKEIDGVEYRIRTEHFRDEEGTDLTTETLLGPRRLSEVRLTRDWVRLRRLDEDITALLVGSVLLRDLAEGTEEWADGTNVAILLSGRQTPVAELVLDGEERPRPIYLPGPGEYLAVAEVEGHANVPAFFTAI